MGSKSCWQEEKDSSSHDVEEPSGLGERRFKRSKGKEVRPPQLGVQSALWRPRERAATQPSLSWQRHQDHQIHAPPLPSHEPLWAASSSGQPVLCGPGCSELFACSECLPAWSGTGPHLHYNISHSPEGCLGGLQKVPVRQEAQQYTVFYLQQVSPERSSQEESSVLCCLCLMWHEENPHSTSTSVFVILVVSRCVDARDLGTVCFYSTSSAFQHPVGILDLEIENVWEIIPLLKSLTTIFIRERELSLALSLHCIHLLKSSSACCVSKHSKVSGYLSLNYWC